VAAGFQPYTLPNTPIRGLLQPVDRSRLMPSPRHLSSETLWLVPPLSFATVLAGNPLHPLIGASSVNLLVPAECEQQNSGVLAALRSVPSSPLDLAWYGGDLGWLGSLTHGAALRPLPACGFLPLPITTAPGGSVFIAAISPKVLIPPGLGAGGASVDSRTR